jgi:hypothetical protein
MAKEVLHDLLESFSVLYTICHLNTIFQIEWILPFRFASRGCLEGISRPS